MPLAKSLWVAGALVKLRLRLALVCSGCYTTALAHPERFAMHIPARATTTWFLVVFLTLLTSVGEMLHEIPGCGHVIEMPGGTVSIGLPYPEPCFFLQAQLPRVESSQGNTLPCYDEDECPICRVLNQGTSNVEIASLGLVFVSLDAAPAIASEVLQSRPRRPYAARAPPLG